MEKTYPITVTQGIRDLPLFFRSFFAKEAIYRAIRIEKEVRTIDSVSVMNIVARPCYFYGEDIIRNPKMPRAMVIPESNLIKTSFSGDAIYDSTEGILYTIDAKLIGREGKTSLLDIWWHNKRRRLEAIAFSRYLAESNNMELGEVRTKGPIDYRDLFIENADMVG